MKTCFFIYKKLYLKLSFQILIRYNIHILYNEDFIENIEIETKLFFYLCFQKGGWGHIFYIKNRNWNGKNERRMDFDCLAEEWMALEKTNQKFRWIHLLLTKWDITTAVTFFFLLGKQVKLYVNVFYSIIWIYFYPKRKEKEWLASSPLLSSTQH